VYQCREEFIHFTILFSYTIVTQSKALFFLPFHPPKHVSDEQHHQASDTCKGNDFSFCKKTLFSTVEAVLVKKSFLFVKRKKLLCAFFASPNLIHIPKNIFREWRKKENGAEAFFQQVNNGSSHTYAGGKRMNTIGSKTREKYNKSKQ
jgi:hypothetical protein